MFFALLRGCGEELRVSLRLSYLAEVLEAFEIAWLVPGGHRVHAWGGRAVLVQLRGGWLKAYIAATDE